MCKMEGAIAHNLENGEFRTSDVAAGEAKSFSAINPYLKRDVLSGLQRNNFVTPTKIQSAAIPIALTGMDLLVQSKSGTGKTLIYVVAAMQMLNKSLKQPQVLIIVPTRELAIQVESIFHSLAGGQAEAGAHAFIGGTDVTLDRQRLYQSRIVIGTLGRLLHLYESKMFNTSHIKLLVLDEADQLYMTNAIKKTVGRVIGLLPKERQIIACSATYENDLDEHLAKLMFKPVLISNCERATVLLGIRQFVYELPDQVNNIEDMRRKVEALQRIFAQLPYEQAILFSNSLMRADSFNNYLHTSGVQCELFTGALNQTQRLVAFEGYRRFTIRTMVATDLMARGVDSSHANLVINLDVPRDHVTYLHRIGRAGRFGSKGIAITLLTSSESNKFKGMLSQIGTGMSVLHFPQEKLKEGFDFWDFDTYTLPYYVKIEAKEQEDSELRRITKTLSQSEPNQQQTTPKRQLNTLRLHQSTNEEIESNKDSGPSKNAVNIVLEVTNPEFQNLNAAERKEELEGDYVRVSIPDPNAETPHDIETPSPSEPVSIDNNETRKQFKSQASSQMPSIDLPPAAPNSINTKTYCLVVPHEPSSTTLQPLGGVSNTVDDASSIISDSVECGYSSDGSYVSYYDSKDERLIWSHFVAQQKLLKRHKLSATKRIVLYPWHYKKKASRKKFPTDNYDENDTENELYTNLLALPWWISRKIKRNNFGYQNYPLLTDRTQLELLKKFQNWQNIRRCLNIYIKKRNWSVLRSNEWIQQLNHTVQQLYYWDLLNRKPSKTEVPEPKSLHTFMELLSKNKETLDKANVNESKAPLGKLSVHVAHQLNIPANNLAPVERAAEANDSNSETDSSYEMPNGLLNEFSEDDDESIEPNSSSGFDERNESASSGIDTSNYDTDSTDHYQFVDDDDEDDDDEGNIFYGDDDEYHLREFANQSWDSISTEATLSSSSNDDDVDDDDDNNDNDDDDDDDNDNDDNGEDTDDDDEVEDEPSDNAENALTVAQNQWQHIFNMQYRFIASYVNNYMANAHPEL